MNDDIMSSAMFKQFFQYLKKQNISTISPLEAQSLIYSLVTNHFLFFCAWQ
jgi:hypothetical protein